MSMVITTIFWLSLACIFASGSVWLYYFGYNRGYSHGHHSGLSLGMFKAYESINKLSSMFMFSKVYIFKLLLENICMNSYVDFNIKNIGEKNLEK